MWVWGLGVLRVLDLSFESETPICWQAGVEDVGRAPRSTARIIGLIWRSPRRARDMGPIKAKDLEFGVDRVQRFGLRFADLG